MNVENEKCVIADDIEQEITLADLGNAWKNPDSTQLMCFKSNGEVFGGTVNKNKAGRDKSLPVAILRS